MKIYIKKKSFDQFYEADVTVRISSRGYKIATLSNVAEISRSRYYRQDKAIRFAMPAVKDDYEIHEIGNADFFNKI